LYCCYYNIRTKTFTLSVKKSRRQTKVEEFNGFGCSGEISPQLSWSNAPGRRALPSRCTIQMRLQVVLALVVFDIPANVNELVKKCWKRFAKLSA
jgi:hypothetical protein